MFRVIEKFVSIDGEGPSSGELATFVRFAGCNLRCSWCDTNYSWDGSSSCELMSVDEIYDYIKASGVRNVTLTGGEPLIQDGIEDLIERLVSDSLLMVRIETNGSVDILPLKERFGDCNLEFIVDLKLPGSAMLEKMFLGNLETVGVRDVYKFVIASRFDLEQAILMVREYGLVDRCRVYFSAVVGKISPRVIVDAMRDECLNGVRFQLQLHKYIWPKDMRGV